MIEPASWKKLPTNLPQSPSPPVAIPGFVPFDTSLELWTDYWTQVDFPASNMGPISHIQCFDKNLLPYLMKSTGVEFLI